MPSLYDKMLQRTIAESEQAKEPDKSVLSREQELAPEDYSPITTNELPAKATRTATDLREHANTLESVPANTRARGHANTREEGSYRKIADQTGYSLFQDQAEFLRNYTLREKLKGKSVSANQIIRDALDLYIEGLKKNI
jgi:hypothetical protein